jgi:YidC/Oxa1 family membrane protein insertase
MDRNSIIGLLLIAGILIGYSLLTRPDKEEIEAARHKKDSIEMVQQQQALQEKQKEQQQNVPADTAATAAPQKLKDTATLQQKKDFYGAFANAATGNDEFVTIENNLIKLKISSKGGRPYSVELKKYKTFDGKPLILFNGDSTIFGLDFFAQNRNISTNDLYFKSLTQKKDIVIQEGDNPYQLTMRLQAGTNRYIDYNYTVKPDSYMVDFNMNFVGMNEIIASNVNYLDLKWLIYLPQQEKGRKNESNYSAIYYKYFQDEVDNFSARSNKDVMEKNIPTGLKWVAFKDQFFSSVLIADNSFSNASIKQEALPETSKYLNIYTAELGVPYRSAPRDSVNMSFYFGPNKYTILKKHGMELQELVSLGSWIIKWINRYVIIFLFNFLNNYIANYGIIILLLTVIIKLVLFPLTYKSYLSMAKMRVLKPQIDEINERIPKDKSMERQQATMALYKKVGVNPMGGCLPTLLQMPILLAMFRFFPSSIELRQQSFLWANDLSTYDSILQLPFTIPFYGDHVSLFTILMTVSTILSMKINNQAQTSSSMPGMKQMMYIMPVMFMFILNNFSAGLTYYYFLANMITFGQNAVIKYYVDDEAILKKLHENKKKPVKKSKFQARLEEAAKQRGYKPPKKK